MFKDTKETLQWQWLGFAAIAFFVLLVYYPSLMHVARADQIMYLGEVAPLNGFKELVIDTYDLNRHRTIAPGDELLFRPVLYFFLGLEKFCFGYNFMGWQAVGLGLHLLVVWQMLRLLLTIRPAFEALWATAFFALLFANMEMVIWHHINAYMIFVVCLLYAIRHVYLLCTAGGQDTARLLRVAGALLIACFTYEPANIYTLMIAVLLWFAAPFTRRYLWVVILPVFLYALASWGNVAWHHYTISEKEAMVKGFHPLLSLRNCIDSIAFWTYAGFFPTQLDMMYAARNMIKDGVALIKPLVLNNGVVVAMLGIIGLWFLGLWRKKDISPVPSHQAFLWMLAGMIAVYTAVIVLGRVGSRGLVDVLRVDLYYMYIFWVLLIPLLYGLVNISLSRRWQKIALALCLTVVIGSNALLLYHANEKQMRENNQITLLVNTLNMLIDLKSGEKDFSFYVADDYPGNYIYPEYRKVTDDPSRMYSFAEILYPQYFTKENPRYKFLTQ